ncbi:hypothetical protein Tco_1377160 [Tanacetum coccineum]
MAAPIISISSDTSEESVGSHAPRVILFGVIPAIIPVIPEVPVVLADPIVTPEVGTVSVVSPAGVLDLVDYSSSSDSDPSEDSLPPAPDLPLVSPFLCSDDSDDFVGGACFEPVEQKTLTPRKLLSARKRVRPIPARRLAWRRVSHHLLDHHSSPDSSSSSDVREDGEEFMVEASAADMREIVVDPLAIADSSESSRGEALAAHEVTRAANALEAKNQSQNGSDGGNGNGGNGDDENGNGGNGNGRNENPDGNGRGDRHVARECTYQNFMKCQPLNFKGTDGVVGLISWFEKMETVFHISNYPEKSQVKYATCTLLNRALTW